MSGITLEYKRTDEYKQWYNMIKAENLDMPDLLIDYAIAFHKANPKAYKMGKQHNAPCSANPRFTTVEDAVRVYDPDELPQAQSIKVVDE